MLPLRLLPRLGQSFRRYASTSAPSTLSLNTADYARLAPLRNLGISAHIDSGKTTLTERVLYYTGRIASIHEVRGKDEVGAKMDSMELEREKGITIKSAATFCEWDIKGDGAKVDGVKGNKHWFNIIDTPGHVDFTIEVERALRVLDGAVLVLCAVSGVQSQTITVDRQMKRYDIPRLCFVNKMDRPGANPFKVLGQLRNKLKLNAALAQVPIGSEDTFEGVVDLVWGVCYRNGGTKGIELLRSEEIPENLKETVDKYRAELVECVADADEELGDKFIAEEPITNEDLASAIRRATISRRFTPVFMGSALSNLAVQPLLDGVCSYLPAPYEVSSNALTVPKPQQTSVSVPLVPTATGPLLALAFKLEESRFGQLTYVRIYQGVLTKGTIVVNVRTGKKTKVPKLVRMHSEEMEEVDQVGAGEIAAIFGVECASGDTLTTASNGSELTMSSMFVPDPVVSLAIRPKGQETPHFSKALQRFQREDPTFRVHVDPDSQETIISGMGELHLEIYIERMKREYNVETVSGRPRVAYKEAITEAAEFNYTHKKQTGGRGQFARVIGRIEPLEERVDDKDHEFWNHVTSGNIPFEYIPGCEKGFQDALTRGGLAGYPVTMCRMVMQDGLHHIVDSSEWAFRAAAAGAFREVYNQASPVILEPIMRVEVIAPIEFQGDVIGGINSRRGNILDTEIGEDEFTLTAEVSLNDMFGYSAFLRGQTQGKGEFTMEYLKHDPVMASVQKEMMEDYKKFRAGGSKK
ncbi:translation elongation factor G [Atractiella rhizophila]|nr:translation elongation factor G [Atractiella rhizophila]